MCVYTAEQERKTFMDFAVRKDVFVCVMWLAEIKTASQWREVLLFLLLDSEKEKEKGGGETSLIHSFIVLKRHHLK